MRADLAPIYLSASDLAARWSVHRITVWKWRALERIPAPVRLPSGLVRWLLRDIEASEEKNNATYVPRAHLKAIKATRIKATSAKKKKHSVRRSKRDRR